METISVIRVFYSFASKVYFANGVNFFIDSKVKRFITRWIYRKIMIKHHKILSLTYYCFRYINISEIVGDFFIPID